jgi:hypothetical protein
MRRATIVIVFGFVLVAAGRVFSLEEAQVAERYTVAIRRCFGMVNSRSERTVQQEVRLPTVLVVENEPAHILIGGETMIDDEGVPYGQSVKLRVRRLKDGRLRTRFDVDLSCGASQMLPEFDGAVVAINSDRLVGVATLTPKVTAIVDCKGEKSARTWLEMTIVPYSEEEKEVEKVGSKEE